MKKAIYKEHKQLKWTNAARVNRSAVEWSLKRNIVNCSNLFENCVMGHCCPQAGHSGNWEIWWRRCDGPLQLGDLVEETAASQSVRALVGKQRVAGGGAT